MNAARSARFYNAMVIERARKRRHRLHVGFGQQLFDTAEKQIGAQFVEAGALRHQLFIRLNDANHLRFRARESAREKTAHMAVNETDDGQAHGRLGFGRTGRQRDQTEENIKDQTHDGSKAGNVETGK
jgi:hypothetical protein